MRTRLSLLLASSVAITGAADLGCSKNSPKVNGGASSSAGSSGSSSLTSSGGQTNGGHGGETATVGASAGELQGESGSGAGRGGSMASGGKSSAGGAGSSGAGGSNASGLQVSANHRYLELDGKPFLLNQEAAWSLGTNVSDADVELYFTDRASRGFNGAVIELIEREDNSNPTGKNFNGDTPFTGTVGAQPDFTTPREAFWKRVDYVLARANAHGVVPLAFPIYVGAVNGRDGWYQAMLANGAARMQTYAKFLAARYGNLRLIWVVGGDLSPASTPTPMSAAGVDDLNAFATALHAALPTAMITAHWAGEDLGSATKYGNADSHVLNAAYLGPITHAEILADYKLAPPLPVIGLEHLYAHESTTSDVVVRSQSYQVMTSGGCGVSYGNGHIWNFDGSAASAKPWKNYLNDPSTGDAQRLFEVFSTRPWHLLVPCDCVTTNRGTLASADYVTSAVTPNGAFMATYAPNAHTGPVTIDMTKMAGTTRARLWDPRAGTLTDVAGSPFPNTGTRDMQLPTMNAAGDHDWLILLESP